MLKHFCRAWKFMRGEALKTRFVFACFYMFQETYRVMPLKCWHVDPKDVGVQHAKAE